MLIVRPIGVTAGAYYHPGPDLGRWTGAGAEALGLSGIPSPEALERVLAGRHPADGSQLGHVHPHRRAGWDLIFAAPKSVSLLAAVAPASDSRIIRLAQRDAVADTLAWVATEAAWARRAQQRVATTGITAAAFEHGNSAAGDPHLHTHVLVANLVQAPDGRWSALDGSLWRERMAIGALYDLALRHQLAARGLGLQWNIGPNGLADVVGVPRAAIDAVSFRHAQVTADLAAEVAVARTEPGGSPTSGQSTSGHRRSHFASTRTREVTPQRDWRHRLADAGFARADATMLLPAQRIPDPGPSRLDPGVATDAEKWLNDRASTWSRLDALRALAVASHGGLAPDTATRLADELCARALPAGPDRWTTTTARQQDQAVLAAARARPVGRAKVPDALLDGILDDRPHLGAGARDLVRRLAGEDAVAVLDGEAGRDRLMQQAAVLDAARAAWQAAGARVAVDAPPAVVSRWMALTALDAPDADRPPAFLVVDRADRRTSGELSVLLESASTTGTKVILVSGGTLPARRRALSEALPGLDHLELPRSLTNEVLPARASIGPTPERTLSPLDPPVAACSGRVVVVSSARDAVAAVVDRWVAHEPGRRPLMIGLGPPEVEALNAAARDRLRDAGALGPEVTVGGRSFAVGDRVISRHSGPGALGATGTVTEISRSPAALTVRWDAVADRADPATADISTVDISTPEVAPAAPEAGPTMLSAWDCRRLVHGYATTPKLAAKVLGPRSNAAADEVPTPVLVLGDPAQLTPLAGRSGREVSGVVVAPCEPTGPPPPDRLWRLAYLERLERPPEVPAVSAIPGSEATLASLAEHRDTLAARLRATLPPDPEPERRRLADDQSWYEQRPGGANPAEQHDLAARADHLRQTDHAEEAWRRANHSDLEQWARLGRAMDQRAALVAHAAGLDPAPSIREVVGPEPAGKTERARWREVAAEIALHAERWPRSAGALEPGAPPGAVISFYRQQRAAQTLARRLGRTPARELDNGLGR
jgi:conjugative relaxase-like TrwC/TraI family protein